ncbi:hypothetical protein QBC44DRAFT_35336 [Cladorrhinum sp. PSN332]|nr:hypothetical protein QBC44DRAFT_35336 [Cladorrhinum sp. PSN332]
MAGELQISDENRGPAVIGVAAAMTALATVAIVLRTWSRYQRRVKFGPDDALLIGSFIILVSHFSIITIAVTRGGLGKPLLVVYLQDGQEVLFRYLKIIFAIQLLTPWALTSIKVSVLAMYWRLFPTKFIRRSCIIIGLFSILWCLSAFLPAIFRCAPIHKFWNPFMEGGSCNAEVGSWVSWQDGIPEVITNFFIWLLPIYEIWRLAASIKTKVAISTVFLLASLSVISSIVRLVLCHRVHLEMSGDGTTVGVGDVTLVMTGALTWAHIEVSTGLIAACLPALRPVGIKILEKIGLVSKSQGSSEKVDSPSGVVTIGRAPGNGGFMGAFRSKKSDISDDSLLADTVVDAGETAEGQQQQQQQTQTHQNQQEQPNFHPRGYETERQYSVQGDSYGSFGSADKTIMIRTEMVWSEDHRRHG